MIGRRREACHFLCFIASMCPPERRTTLKSTSCGKWKKKASHATIVKLFGVLFKHARAVYFAQKIEMVALLPSASVANGTFFIYWCFIFRICLKKIVCSVVWQLFGQWGNIYLLNLFVQIKIFEIFIFWSSVLRAEKQRLLCFYQLEV